VIQFECRGQTVSQVPAHLRFTSVGFLFWSVVRDFVYALLGNPRKNVNARLHFILPVDI